MTLCSLQDNLKRTESRLFLLKEITDSKRCTPAATVYEAGSSCVYRIGDSGIEISCRHAYDEKAFLIRRTRSLQKSGHFSRIIRRLA